MTRRLAVALAMAILAPALGGQRVTYEGALSAATGRYFFTERTSAFGLSTGLSLRQGRWTVRASVPTWLQNTTLVSTSGLGPVPTGGPDGQGAVSDSGQAREQRRQGKASADPTGTGSGGDGNGQGGNGNGGSGSGSGNGAGALVLRLAEEAVPAPDAAITGYEARLGDPLVGVAVRIVDRGPVAVTLGTTVKIPVASTDGIGTGAWDLGASVAASAGLGRRTTIGLDLAYWRLGDLDNLELRDPVFGSLSLGALLSDRWSGLVAVSAGSRPLTGFDPPVMVTLAVSRYGNAAAWGVSLGTGLTESSPDLMVGLTWSIPLNGRGMP